MARFTHRPITDDYTLSKFNGCKKTYWLTTPLEIDVTPIKDYLKKLPGNGVIIVEDTVPGKEIWFTCTLPIKEVAQKMAEMLGVKEPKKYGCGCYGGKKKKIYKCDAEGNVVAEYMSGTEAARENNLSPSSITKSAKTGRFFNGYRYHQ